MVATVVELRSSAMAVTYYERDGYYAKNDPEHRQASFWYGDSAKALGLKAHVRPSRFESVLSGYVPGTDLRLGRMREGEHDHRPGWGHHPVRAEVGIAGGAGDGRPPRDPGSRRGGAGDAGLRGGGATADPGLGPPRPGAAPG